jgi:hypothetical protein
MAVNYMLTREVELAVQEEATYGTSPGAVAGTDMFKHKSRLHFTPSRGRYYRDQDADYAQASVLSAQTGRRSAAVKIDCDFIPSGNAATITAPDIDLLLKAHMGTKHAATAHTVTVAGSAGTNLKLAVGGVAASGVLANDLIAVDVSTAVGYEVRRVIALVGGGTPDDVTLDRALTTDPAAARTVKLGTTYKLLNTANLSLYVWQWIAATLARHVVPGCVFPDMDLAVSFAQEVPQATVSFAGSGMDEATHATARPTSSTAGVPQVPATGFVWNGASKLYLLSAGIKSNNGLETRNNESGSLQPTGVKRTGNNSRYSIEQTLSMLLTTGDRDTGAVYDAAKTSDATPLDILVQSGQTPGNILAWATPKFTCDPSRTEQDGEFALQLSGRCIGTTGDDELFIGVI